MRLPALWGLVTALGLYGHLTTCIELNLSSPDSIRSVGGTIAYDLMSIYKGNQSGGTPGILPSTPYYWWESGGMWGVMIDYWYYTNDTSYNAVVEEGILYQTGPNNDFMPPNQTLGMGNDDQGYWGMTAMTAAELRFQDPPPSSPQWLSLSQAVFNQLAWRWDTTACGGGLRWPVYWFGNGWTYKSAIATGCLFNLGARLAQYTQNDSYAQWAEKSWDWITGINMIQLQSYQPYNKSIGHFNGTDGVGAGGFVAWDGADTGIQCSVINHVAYSYNAGTFLWGAAAMYNYTNGSDIWANRTSLLLNATLNMYFPSKIGTEISCEYNLTVCDVDQYSFKAYLTRGLAATSQIAPFTASTIMPYLSVSAAAAAQQCVGGPSKRMCGLTWLNGSHWDGTSGAGQQMAALEVILANMLNFNGQTRSIVSNTTGGTSVGNPGAGAEGAWRGAPAVGPAVSVAMGLGDRVGAGIVTVMMLSGLLGGLLWINLDLSEKGWVPVQKPLLEWFMGVLRSWIIMA